MLKKIALTVELIKKGYNINNNINENSYKSKL